MADKYATIFDGWSSASIPVVEDEDIVVAHDASRGTLDESDLKSSKTTT